MVKARDVISLIEELQEKNWIDKVKPKWHPPEGLFTRDPETIAKTVAKASKDLKQAVARVNFFYNRYGCSGDRKNDSICKKKDKVLKLLHKIFGESFDEATQLVLYYDEDEKEFLLVFPSGSTKEFHDENDLLQYLRDNNIKGLKGESPDQLIMFAREQGMVRCKK